jgi:6-phosphogluconolactonase
VSASPARVEVLPGPAALFDAAAERVQAAAADAVRATGAFRIALSGGSTPRGLYERLAQPRWAERIDWRRVHVFWGDERCVPADDPASNQRMAREAWLGHVPLAADQVHAIRGEGDPEAPAADYERELRPELATPEGPPRTAPGARLDLVLLGLGEDGHTASLFPGSAALRETRRWVCAERTPRLAAWRIGMTLLPINAAAQVLFLVSGREKAGILRRVLGSPPEPAGEALPAQAVAPCAGELHWLVDAAAAQELAERQRA